MDSDLDERRRRRRNVAVATVPTAVVAALVLALGLPWWAVAGAAVLFLAIVAGLV